MSNITNNLIGLNLILPEATKPVANYSPYLIVNNKIYVSGQIPFEKGEIIYKGKVGIDISIVQAKKAAELCLINTCLLYTSPSPRDNR